MDASERRGGRGKEGQRGRSQRAAPIRQTSRFLESKLTALPRGPCPSHACFPRPQASHPCLDLRRRRNREEEAERRGEEGEEEAGGEARRGGRRWRLRTQ